MQHHLLLLLASLLLISCGAGVAAPGRSAWRVAAHSTVHFTPGDLWDNGYNSDEGDFYRSSPFARAVFHTPARTVTLQTYSTIYSTVPQYATIGVRVNGRPYERLDVTGSGQQEFTLALPAGDKTIEFIAGFQDKPRSEVLGTFLVAATFDSEARLSRPDASPDRIVIYGDSISVGAGTTSPTEQAWTILLREELPLVVEGWGYRSLYDDARTTPLREALVARLAGFDPSTIWLAIGTNDYGLSGKWGAAEFGRAYGSLLDDLHRHLPNSSIYCQTPLVRSDERANEFGSTLDDYRAQIHDACLSRTWTKLVDGTTILGEADLVDGIHPTVEGHEKYSDCARNILNTIQVGGRISCQEYRAWLRTPVNDHRQSRWLVTSPSPRGTRGRYDRRARKRPGGNIPRRDDIRMARETQAVHRNSA